MGLFSASLLAGCSILPVYQRPAAPAAAARPALDNPVAVTAGMQAPVIEWQTFFTDPKLKLLIENALQSNRDLRIAVLNVEQARAQFQIRRADQIPTVNAVVAGSRQPARASNGDTFIPSTHTAGLAMTAYELDFFGRVASLKEHALAQYLATEEGRQSA